MRITSRVHGLKIPFQITTPLGIIAERYVYVYIIFGDRIRLVDSGVAGSEKLIFDHIKREGRKPEDIDAVILTHSHPDHIGSISAIKEKTKCKVMAHADEKAWIEDTGLQEKERPVPGFRTLVYGPVKVDTELQDGGIVDMGDMTFMVMHTPGHSRGSVSIFFEEEKVLFSGDAVPVEGNMPVYDDFKSSLMSLEKLKKLKEIDMLLSSWDEPRKGGAAGEAIKNGIEYMRTIDKAIARNRSVKDPMELCAAVVRELGLALEAVNPLVARSFMSH